MMPHGSMVPYADYMVLMMVIIGEVALMMTIMSTI
jgi:hypothetical protein